MRYACSQMTRNISSLVVQPRLPPVLLLGLLGAEPVLPSALVSTPSKQLRKWHHAQLGSLQSSVRIQEALIALVGRWSSSESTLIGEESEHPNASFARRALRSALRPPVTDPCSARQPQPHDDQSTSPIPPRMPTRRSSALRASLLLGLTISFFVIFLSRLTPASSSALLFRASSAFALSHPSTSK